jgi:hypothetical protein
LGIFSRKPPYPAPLNRPEAPMPNPDVLIPPAGEADYIPLRSDGQAFILDEENFVNMTPFLNSQYFNPSWRGENWTPYQNFGIAEHMLPMMSLWSDYDEFSLVHRCNTWHKFFEKWSGYGP